MSSAPSSSWPLPVALASGCVTPVSASTIAWPPFCSHVSLGLSFIRTLVVAFRIYLDNAASSPHIKVLNFVTCAKTLFPE